MSDQDNFNHMQKLDQLFRIFMVYELHTHEPPWTWSGDFSVQTSAILDKFSTDSGVNDLQKTISRFVATAKINRSTPLNPKFIHRLLIEMDKLWLYHGEQLTQEQEQWVGDAMSSFLEKSLNQIETHRYVFVVMNPSSMVRLEYLLRCLGLMGSMRAFRHALPFSKGIRGEIVSCLRKGSLCWAKNQLKDLQRNQNAIVKFSFTLIADIELGLKYYHPIFDT